MVNLPTTEPTRIDHGFLELEKFLTGSLVVELETLPSHSSATIAVVSTTTPTRPTQLEYFARHWALNDAKIPPLVEECDREHGVWTLCPLGRRDPSGAASSASSSMMSGLLAAVTGGKVGQPHVRSEVTITVPAAMLTTTTAGIKAGSEPRYTLDMRAANASLALQGDAPHRWRRLCMKTCDGDLYISAGVQVAGTVELVTTTGTILVDNGNGTGAEPMHVGNQLTIKSTTAAITLRGSVTVGGGAAHFETVNGAISVHSLTPYAGGDVVLSSVNGSITVDELRVPSPGHTDVTAGSVNANVSVDLVSIGDTDGESQGTVRVKVTTVNGSVQLRMPVAWSYDYSLSTVIGKTSVRGKGFKKARGTVGIAGSGCSVDASSVLGSIKIK
ncbi:hypothetical protein BC828DRAFT_405214 [Blastocladiella britannica]|nr:hypothetical protein BC828DRAFT_405214 [Blastocladiella britannica]